MDVIVLIYVFISFGVVLGFDWVQGVVMCVNLIDLWECLLVVGFSCDFQQIWFEWFVCDVVFLQVCVVVWFEIYDVCVCEFCYFVDWVKVLVVLLFVMLVQIVGQVWVLFGWQGFCLFSFGFVVDVGVLFVGVQLYDDVGN